MKLEGKITKILANFYYVQDKDGKTWECFARARLLKEGKFLFVGDELEIETTGKNQGVIVDLINRRNKITKPPMANVDQVIIVFSTCEPEFDFYNLDRYLSYVRYELPNDKTIICLNKIDLLNFNITNVYKKSNCDIFYVSALTREGLDNLVLELTEKVSVLTGPSGAGKSSLIKALVPEADIKIGSITLTKQGTHTTRNIQLIPIKTNAFIVDTPGFTQISFNGLDNFKILNTFPELVNLGCNFSNCLHSGEDGCKLIKLIESGLVPESRYKSFLRILDESKSEVVYGKKQETKIKLVGGRKEKSKLLPKINAATRTKSRKKQKQELLKLEEMQD